MWQDWTNGVLGLAVIVVAFLALTLTASTLGWTLGILGAVIAVVGFWGAALDNSSWQDWTNGVLGLAVLGLPFLALSGSMLGWTLGILGALIAIVGFWAAGSLTGESAGKHSHA